MIRTRLFPNFRFLSIIILMTAMVGTSAVASPVIIEVNTSRGCADLPPPLSGACLANTGSKEPFRYYEARSELECRAFLDSSISANCLERVRAGSAFRIPKTDVDYTTEVHEPLMSPIEQVASSTQTLVVLTAINLGITLSAIVVGAVVFFISLSD